MIYTYEECKTIFGTDYEIRKNINLGKLRRIRKGIYSDNEFDSDFEFISKAYPHAVFTMESALYYHNLTDTIPKEYHLMTSKNDTKIRDEKIIQHFDNNDSLKLGAEEKIQNGTIIRIFNRERMLVELIRNKNKLPFDYYKEIINNYRKIINELDLQILYEYTEALPKSKLVTETLQLEVF